MTVRRCYYPPDLSSLIQIYSEKEQSTQRKIQNAQFEEKRDMRKDDGNKSCAQGIKPNVKSLKLIGIMVVVMYGQYPT